MAFIHIISLHFSCSFNLDNESRFLGFTSVSSAVLFTSLQPSVPCSQAMQRGDSKHSGKQLAFGFKKSHSAVPA